ncbi:MAG: hypothetical protein V7767_12020, partial [Leeuwenhoekiella sp.]
MLLKKTNIHDQLIRERRRKLGENSVLDQVTAILKAHKDNEDRIIESLQNTEQGVANVFNIDVIEADRIFHKNEIKKICIIYRLRFLDTKYFKGDFHQETLNEIKNIETEHNTHLEGFKIIAPSKMFVLRKT